MRIQSMHASTGLEILAKERGRGGREGHAHIHVRKSKIKRACKILAPKRVKHAHMHREIERGRGRGQR